MKVRFKKGVSDNEFRISYEVESDIPTMEYDEVQERYCLCYNLKLLGFVWVELLEVDDSDTSIPAIDIMIQIKQT